MELDAELVNVARNLSALRFVFLELILEIRNPEGVTGRGDTIRRRHDRGIPAALTLQRDACGCGINDVRRRTVGAGENNILSDRCGCFSGSAGRLHHRESKQGTYP